MTGPGSSYDSQAAIGSEWLYGFGFYQRKHTVVVAGLRGGVENDRAWMADMVVLVNTAFGERGGLVMRDTSVGPGNDLWNPVAVSPIHRDHAIS